MNKKINYGVVGAGHLGRVHVQQLLRLNNVNFMGVYDVFPSKTKTIYIFRIY